MPGVPRRLGAAARQRARHPGEEASNVIRIRPAREADAETIVDFQIRMARETEDLHLDAATASEGVRAVFAEPARGRYWLAEVDGQVAACLLTVPEWSDWRNGTVLWIHSLYVRPEFRRRGIFARLYGHLREMVEADTALKGLRLYVDRTNAAARKAYEAMGMDGEHYQTYEWLK
jgi:GNAT superfamily N-acetyltransferase